MTDAAVNSFRPIELLDRANLATNTLVKTLQKLTNVTRDAMSLIGRGKTTAEIKDLSSANRELAASLLNKEDISPVTTSKAASKINIDSLVDENMKVAALILNYSNSGPERDLTSKVTGQKKASLINELTTALQVPSISYETDLRPELDKLREIQALPKGENQLTKYLEKVYLPKGKKEGTRFNMTIGSPLFSRIKSIFNNGLSPFPSDKEFIETILHYKKSMAYVLLGTTSRLLEKRKPVSLENLMTLKEHENFRIAVDAIVYLLKADSKASKT